MSSNREQTIDAILGGALRIIQPRDGYRFSLDSILLGRFASMRPARRILELGAGGGVVSIITAKLLRPREVVAVELQPGLAELIERNAELNQLTAVTALCADLRSRVIARLNETSFDLVLANPPYRRTGSGRESPNESRRMARGESAGTLNDFVAAAARYARIGGRTAFVFGAARSAELIAGLRSCGLEPKRLRFVHALDDSPASAVLVEARKGGGVEALIEPPLVLYERPGVYTAEAHALLFSISG